MNKKFKALIAALVLVGGSVGLVAGCGSSSPKVNIKANPTKKIEYSNLNYNNLLTMQIPAGWQLSVYPKADAVHFTFMIENPKDKNYRIYFNMKSEGYLSSEKQRQWYAKSYPNAPMAKLPAIDPQTTEQFYKMFTQANKMNNVKDFTFPVMNNFTKSDVLGKNVTGGEIIRGNYIDANKKKVDGIFTCTIKPVSLGPVTALNVYNTVFFTVPDGDLPEWEPILNHCISTIKFSDKFMETYNRQQKSEAQTSAALSKIANETSNIITSGWNQRQKTYDVISQKQSDATMGYERVYNTETKEIYKAELGFSDHDWGGKYKKVTDDMYTQPTAGYIERVK